MSGKIDGVPREWLENYAGLLTEHFALAQAREVRALLAASQCSEVVPQCSELLRTQAAPVVERQEPVAYIVEVIDPNNGHLRRRGLHWHSVETLRGTRDFKEWIDENLAKEQPLYTSPPAPVAVVLPERAHEDYPEGAGLHFGKGWNACLDKVKELNQ